MKPLIICRLFSFVFLFLSSLVIGQPNNSIQGKKGIYLDEKDFVTRNSSVKDSFLIRYIVKDKLDASIIGARFYTKVTARRFGQMWGFCDGENIFIRYPQTLVKNKSCYKLDYIGTLSYFAHSFS